MTRRHLTDQILDCFVDLRATGRPICCGLVKSLVCLVISALLLSGSSFGVSITFSVKLSAPLKTGQFAKVETDRTGLDDLPLLKDSIDPTIWRATFDFDPTRFLLYRFALSLGTGGIFQEEAEGDPGRVVYMTNDVIVLPLAHYNLLQDSLKNTVTFRVDMREAIASGEFSPAIQQIGLSGPLVDDNPYFRISFTRSLSMPGVYAATVPILTALPGDTVTYNYTISDAPEVIGPRSFVLQGGAQVLPIDYLDNLKPPSVTGSLDGLLSIELAPEQSVTITWKAAPGVHLQRSNALNGLWSTVSETDGIGSITLSATNAVSFFRLATDF